MKNEDESLLLHLYDRFSECHRSNGYVLLTVEPGKKIIVQIEDILPIPGPTFNRTIKLKAKDISGNAIPKRLIKLSEIAIRKHKFCSLIEIC
jgi:hypothetical protein